MYRSIKLRYLYNKKDKIPTLDDCNKQIIDRQQDWKTENSIPWNAADYSNAMFGEFGEAANKIKKLRRIQTEVKGNKSFETEEYLRKEIEKELADGYQYLILLCNNLDISLKDGVIETFNAKSKQIGSEFKI